MEELDSHKKALIKIFNKVDALNDKTKIDYVLNKYKNSVLISAERGINIGALKKMLTDIYEENFVEGMIELPHHESKIISELYKLANILSIQYNEEKTIIKYRASITTHNKIQRMVKSRL